ncbi:MULTISPECIES: 1-(5-phosphoribosyl)-5-[(5-phosphoribosylamino)methylideneamino]imidazole-4-carboxamide isomerase [unclassified Methanoregula]|uniref:1-(5-phosphoribosyl)-5-[(5- phosphoribosylamino)methylideneamino]imidazole-4- carboxamide isomerase n=1 Tax=unclassified Methanoregula TaxID=2649730 RepID=UPI0009D53400|nr:MULTISPECIES: 1-(5-phosphoribosyl)-5-[(5-phosphoribosylamino)methylideneamino]imidazole-4-carboxamide isomerase [unclassified Methanoregula]OPX62506.1 MAG: Imidazole glycerol phosphate synthase subunit HisF [Methanoregula sp. PtaB.Bin085]OPY31605.1 MAG: Imidazole glycerol phosphate synthase subunit HisF [Methanoregula sp. PtaU1.Bin006]
MKIFPAVDILGGKCVQLVQGKRESATAYGDPLACATRWLSMGATALHVVNLDGAFGTSSENARLIREIIKKTGTEIELGGGIRSVDDARQWLETGVDRVIISTLATQDPGCIRTLADEFGSGRIMPGVDAKGGQIAVHGWQETAGDFLGWAKKFEELGAGSLLYTNVDVEGLQQGVRLEPVKLLIGHVRIPVVVAGGVSTRADVAGLRDAGAHGAVLGSALYSGKITLKDALEECR